MPKRPVTERERRLVLWKHGLVFPNKIVWGACDPEFTKIRPCNSSDLLSACPAHLEYANFFVGHCNKNFVGDINNATKCGQIVPPHISARTDIVKKRVKNAFKKKILAHLELAFEKEWATPKQHALFYNFNSQLYALWGKDFPKYPAHWTFLKFAETALVEPEVWKWDKVAAKLRGALMLPFLRKYGFNDTFVTALELVVKWVEGRRDFDFAELESENKLFISSYLFMEQTNVRFLFAGGVHGPPSGFGSAGNGSSHTISPGCHKHGVSRTKSVTTSLPW